MLCCLPPPAKSYPASTEIPHLVNLKLIDRKQIICKNFISHKLNCIFSFFWCMWPLASNATDLHTWRTYNGTSNSYLWKCQENPGWRYCWVSAFKSEAIKFRVTKVKKTVFHQSLLHKSHLRILIWKSQYFPSSTLGSHVIRQKYFLRDPSVLMQLSGERSLYAFVPFLLSKCLPWIALLLGFLLLWPAQMDIAKSSLSLQFFLCYLHIHTN